MELYEEVLAVETKDDLRRVVERMKEDLLNNPAKWENRTLEQFLDAMAEQIDGMDALYKNLNWGPTPVKPSWRVFADILYGARIHE
jgi:hypothetical protein